MNDQVELIKIFQKPAKKLFSTATTARTKARKAVAILRYKKANYCNPLPH